jgi:hypothetical protein
MAVEFAEFELERLPVVIPALPTPPVRLDEAML